MQLIKLLILAKEIKQKNLAICEYSPKKLKAHLKAADKINSKFCCVIGEDELKQNSIWVKDLETKEEKVVKIEQFLQSIKK